MIDRRQFLWFATSAVGLVWGCGRRRVPEPATLELVPLLAIGTDESIVVTVARTEMGQSVTTALPMLLAEELDCDWARVTIENARVDPRHGDQFTTASVSVFESWEPYRKAGATARALLVEAAARAWDVPAARLRTDAGFVVGPAGERASYGSLAPIAATLPHPAIELDDRRPPRLLGKPLRRLDTPAKIDGSARFGIDVRVPDMLFGCVARPPRAGATPARHDEAAARRVEGVRHVVPISSGIAVLADDTWAAMQGVSALAVAWTGGATTSSTDIAARLVRELELPATTIASTGDVDRALAVARTLTATYTVPFVPHATMEPVNATAHVEPGKCTLWAPTQAPSWNRKLAARLLDIPESAVEIHRTFAGGGFGRKSCQDFVQDAIEASRAVSRPVQIVFTREDDFRHDYFRPGFAMRLTGAVVEGRIAAWDHRLAGPSVRASWVPFAPPKPDAHDDIATAGAEALPYDIPSFRASARMVDTGVRTGIWRSIGHAYTCFANESFVDELARLAGRDPVEFRLAHLAKSPRARRVLEAVAERSRWASRGDRRLGVALNAEYAPDDDFAVYVAHAVEVRGNAVERVWVAADAGRIVNPNIATAQLEGAAAWALSALSHAITFEAGEVVQRSFHDVPVVRMPRMPPVDVQLIESTARASGLGEKGVPSLGPALANALATGGVRPRDLPLSLE